MNRPASSVPSACALRRILAVYLRPAHFQDELIVSTSLIRFGGASILPEQQVRRGDETLFQASITLVCMAGPMTSPMTGSPQAARIPAEIRALPARSQQ